MVTYQTHTSMAVPTVNSEVLAIGDVYKTNRYDVHLGHQLINKVLINTTSPHTISLQKIYGQQVDKATANITTNNPILHTDVALLEVVSPAVKVFQYLTRSNGKAYLNLVFKEMKYNGTDWGDDNTFNIVDNVSTTTDFYGQTVLIGQKQIELPYFIGGNE